MSGLLPAHRRFQHANSSSNNIAMALMEDIWDEGLDIMYYYSCFCGSLCAKNTTLHDISARGVTCLDLLS